MAKTYRATPMFRAWTGIAKRLIRMGLGAARWRVLTVRGRQIGRLYSTPVSFTLVEGRPWLVSPYGRHGWAANAIAAGEVMLERGHASERVRLQEVAPTEAAPVLRAYLEAEPITRPYFDVTLASSDAELAFEAPRHPVFALEFLAPTAEG